MTAAPVRPRYGRIGALSAAVLVTLVAVLGGVGVLPRGGQPAQAATTSQGTVTSQVPVDPVTTPASGDAEPTEPPRIALSADQSGPGTPLVGSDASASRTYAMHPVPARSGEGRRVVFDMGQQRVWLVRADGTVARTYPVSGSVTDNLDPGTYAVESRSMDAWGIDDSGHMHYMVRFAHGDHAAIGFHDIPKLHGEWLQSEEDLGTPQSHGCIRQARPDAKALWRFTPIGTAVVVVGHLPG